MKALTTVFLAMCVAACAHQPQHAQDSVVARNKVRDPAPSQPPVDQPTPATPAVAGAAPSGGASKPAVNMALVKQGYHAGMRNGQLAYCRREQITGSQFKTEVCLTEGQILAEQRAARDTMTAPLQNHYCGDPCTR
jgi:hypothetical protein